MPILNLNSNKLNPYEADCDNIKRINQQLVDLSQTKRINQYYVSLLHFSFELKQRLNKGFKARKSQGLDIDPHEFSIINLLESKKFMQIDT
jgi:hypothetical protein